MKRFVLVIAALLFAGNALAFSVNFTKTETMTVNTSTQLKGIIVLEDDRVGYESWYIEYYFVDANGEIIKPLVGAPNGKKTFYCQNAGEDDPATPFDERTCFNDTYRFAMRQQDVGKEIGVGFKTLAWSKAKHVILKVADNAGIFVED
jgi:hypothetical protein